MTLWTVLNKVDHASLWNTITMLVFGKYLGYSFFLQLELLKKNEEKLKYKTKKCQNHYNLNWKKQR